MLIIKRSLGMILVCLMLSGPISTISPMITHAGTIGVAVTRDRAAIVKTAIKLQQLENIGSTAFSEPPSLVAPYRAGTLKPELLDDALNTLKMVRYLAGVPYDDISLTMELNNSAQHKSVLAAATGEVGHNLQKPVDMSDSFYQAGMNTGYSRCELNHVLFSTKMSMANTKNAILSLVGDNGINNCTKAGHRTTILDPTINEFGIGYANDFDNPYPKNMYGNREMYGSYYYIHTKRSSEAPAMADTFVAWPSAGDFPIQYFSNPSCPWTITLGADYQAPDKNNILLMLTRIRDGKVDRTWMFDANTPNIDNNQEYASTSLDHLCISGNTIIFRPNLDDIGTIENGDVFSVSVSRGIKTSGGVESTLSFSVSFFDVEIELGGRSINNSGNAGEIRIPETEAAPKGFFTAKGSTWFPFTDVKQSDWFYDTVSSVYSESLMIGSSATAFDPHGNITIAQAVTMAARAHAGGETAIIGSDGGSRGINWYDVYVNYAIKNGIISAYDFSDYNNVIASRAQMAYIFSNVIPADLQYPIRTRLPPDVSENDQYYQEIYRLYRAGVLIGIDSAGTFAPHSSITRAEAATIILRVHYLQSKAARGG